MHQITPGVYAMNGLLFQRSTGFVCLLLVPEMPDQLSCEGIVLKSISELLLIVYK